MIMNQGLINVFFPLQIFPFFPPPAAEGLVQDTVITLASLLHGVSDIHSFAKNFL